MRLTAFCLWLSAGRPAGQHTDISCLCRCVADGVVMWRGVECVHWPTSEHKKLCSIAHDLHVWWRWRATATGDVDGDGDGAAGVGGASKCKLF